MKNNKLANPVRSGLLQFTEMGDIRGSLVAMESGKNIPFEFKRVYFIYNTKPDKPRGFHAMRNSYQVMVCLAGSVDVLLDDSNEKRLYQLNSKDKGLFIDKMIWHEMHNFSEDCVLMVLSDAYYEEYDNLGDYDEFLNLVKTY